MTVLAWHQECYDRASRHNKFYRAYLIGSTAAYQYGPRGSVGQLTTAYAGWGTIETQLRSKERGGYQTLVEQLPLDLPDSFNPRASGVLEVLDAAFARAWRLDWVDALAQLPSADDSEDRFVALLPGWAPLKKTWRGQDTTQPWGPALAEALSGCVRADSSDKDVTLAVVGSRVASWLQSFYMGPAGQGRAQVLAARDSDSVDVLRTALQLWQPASTVPLAQLPTALDAARAVVM